MFGLKLAQALSHMANSLLTFSDFGNQSLILLSGKNHGDVDVSQFDGSELLEDRPNSGQVDWAVPVIQNGHHTTDSRQSAFKNLLQVCATDSIFLKQNAVLIVHKKTHVQEHGIRGRIALVKEALKRVLDKADCIFPSP